MLFIFPLILQAQDFEGEKYDSIREAIIQSGRQAFFKKELNKLKDITKQVYSIYAKNKDSVLLAKYYHFKALQNKLTYKNDSTFYYYHESKNISKLTNDSIQTGRRLLSIANLQRNAKDYLGSEISSIEALQYLEPIKSYRFLESIYNNLGIISRNLNNYKSSNFYFKKAIEANVKNSNIQNLPYIYNGIGLSYQNQEKHKKAIEYFLIGLAIDSIEIKYPLRYALLLENLTYSEYKLNKKKSTINRYEEVLKIRKNKGDLSNLSITHNLLSEVYNDRKNIIKARYHANKALELAKETHNNERWLEALEILSDLSMGEQSKQFLEEYIKLNDSLFTEERKLKNQFAKIRYETAKKEEENVSLKAENERRVIAFEKQRQQKIIGWLVATLSLLILLSSVSFFSFRRKKLLFQAQLQKIEVREKERRQIAKSLHDEVAGDLRMLHQKLAQSQLLVEAQKLEMVKDNVRNLSHQLSSISFEKVTFIDQIINLVSDYFEPNFRIRTHHLKKIDWTEVDNPIKRVLYLSIRESIQNCKKYAEATRMDISFKVYKKSVLLTIQDNGIGFDTNTSKKGIGLQNMQERVEELQGKLAISSELHKGTNIEIQVPLNA
ncbi:ATP-binding protein [uncultured Tenacibaculum sp.]|uniref:tetratricopeptide repeat-containing sensor histidine kinase n=1 Tax=uncultured Tenacibaculum sp. TaxID=174713 RepID=UPI00261F0713|nr:ATP-binding protein [uncultured Tenacibaculum sp.]